MALSAKRIIEIIKDINTPVFDAQTVIHLFISRSKKDSSKKNPKQSARDIRTIHETIAELIAAELLKPVKKGYSCMPFTITGFITIKKGHAECEYKNSVVIIKSEDVGTAHNGDNVAIDIIDIRKHTLIGRVKKVLSKSRDTFFGFVETKTKGMLIIRLVDLPGEHYATADRFDGEPDIKDYLTVQLTGKSLGGKAHCEIIERFQSGSDTLDVERIILRHNLPGKHKEYPEYTTINDSVSAEELNKRKDFRSLLTVTIDGEHAKDFDDAVSFEKHESFVILYVHIADVSAYVLQNSLLDTEAYRRGTSYYLGDKVVPMLPEILSNNLCSLKPHEDRLTLTAIMKFNIDGKSISSSFTRGIIRSEHRLTYTSAHELISKPDGSPLSDMLSSLHSFTAILKKHRLERGRVDLQMNDFEMVFEKGNFEDFIKAPRYTSHALIEEAMLSANEAVSKALKDANIPSLYRVHEPMSSDQLTSLKNFLRTMGVTFREGKNLGRSLQSIVDAVKEKEYSHVVNFVILRSMMQAFYGEKPMGHFGLGFTDYTHFTSPIRRYPDLIVHRCLKALIDGTKPPYAPEELSGIGLESSRLERIAQKAERDLFKLKSCRMMDGHVGENFSAIISGVSKYGIYVTLADSPIEGMVPLRTLTDDYYIVIEDQFSAVGKKYGKMYRLGDRVNVRLSRVDILMMQIDFEIIHGKGSEKRKSDMPEKKRYDFPRNKKDTGRTKKKRR
jgi:ribonuclease R